MDKLTSELLRNFTFDTKDFNKKYVPIALGLPYIHTLMKYCKQLYPEVKVSGFLELKRNPNIRLRSWMLDMNSHPEIFLVAERIEADGDEPERTECYFLKSAFNEITNYIMLKEQTAKDNASLPN